MNYFWCSLLLLIFSAVHAAQRGPSFFSTAKPASTKIPPSAVAAALTRQCLDCICYAGTGCDPNVRCHNAGPGAYYCGPYQISWAYWADGGKPGNDPKNPIAFEQCLNDKRCSEEAIFGYMKKYARDCDGDGKFTCDDVARIHKGGPYSCNGTWLDESEYWKNYLDCSRTGQKFDVDSF